MNGSNYFLFFRLPFGQRKLEKNLNCTDVQCVKPYLELLMASNIGYRTASDLHVEMARQLHSIMGNLDETEVRRCSHHKLTNLASKVAECTVV